MERRQFFYLAGFATTSVLVGNFVASCSKDSNSPVDTGNTGGNGNKVTLDLTDPSYSSLTTPGNSLVKDNYLVIHTSDDKYIALSKICTHQGCTVGFNGTQVVCPCHGSKFSTTGAVINGPATSALTKYTVTLTGNTLTIG